MIFWHHESRNDFFITKIWLFIDKIMLEFPMIILIAQQIFRFKLTKFLDILVKSSFCAVLIYFA